MVQLLSIFLAISAIWIISAAWKYFNRVWLRPKKIEKFLRSQGINGTPYKFFNGSATAETFESKPMELSHQIVPRVMPSALPMVEKYGKVSFSWLGTLPMVTILDQDMIREVLTNKSGHFEQQDFPHPVKLVANGFFNLKGEKWIKHRRIFSPVFRQDNLRLMLPVIDACCRQMVEKWQKLVSEGSSELDVQPELLNLVADVITRTTFGSNYEGRRVQQLYTEQYALYGEAISTSRIPFIEYFPTKTINRMKKIHREVRSLLRDVINKREGAFKIGEVDKSDLLSALMESNSKEINNNRNSKNDGMTTDEVIEECMTFYIGGRDTTSSLLTWTMIVLSMHPDWQEKAREEVMRVFGRNAPYFDGLNQLKIVVMILNEVLRLYTPIIPMARVAQEKVKLGEVILPEGVLISISILLTHHDRELWGEDVDEFKPERFSEGVARATDNEFSFFPFSWGPRICPGQIFAMVEAKMVIAIILQHFSFELSTNYAHAPIYVVTTGLKAEHGAKLVLRKL